ncbi:MAG TPA: antibiotic biosynthesis monooxygenase [Stellaceae bacterium]|nr:antibiotic biosynthesis monooxygenase [Stellaceae bacterium]
MFAVIFEVQPRKERFEEYLEIAKSLKPAIEKIDGFIDNERFASKRREGRILSLSTWRDEKSVIRWRTLAVHHQAQEKGRSEIFEDYHLRVGEIVADTALPKGQVVREQRLDETEVGAAKAVTLSELAPKDAKPASADLAADLGLANAPGLLDHELFESIYNPGKQVLLASWKSAVAAAEWKPKAIAGSVLRHRRLRVIRDYGLLERREAPQYYPPVERSGAARGRHTG